jgi:polysaccharide export outer membrane protein
MACRIVVVGLLLLVSSVATSKGSNEYRLGAEDVVSVAVWERPDLSRTVTVRAGGQITFPPLGDIQAAGETASSLARKLERRLDEFLRRPTQVTVEVIEFNSQRITVSGAVAAPGRLSYEKIPGIVEILGAAGGLGPEADLSRVQVFRTRGVQKTTVTVNLAAALASGDLSGLPELQAQDVVFVPAVAGEVGQATSGVYVSGEVAQPGVYGVGTGFDLLKVLSLAGGTLPTADLGAVQIVSQDLNGGSFVVEVDLERYLDHGVADFVVRPGDAVRVPSYHKSVAGVAWLVTLQVLGASRDILNLFLISDVLNER